MTGWFSLLLTETVIITFIANYPTGRLLQALSAQNASLKSCARGRIVYFYIELIVYMLGQNLTLRIFFNTLEFAKLFCFHVVGLIKHPLI